MEQQVYQLKWPDAEVQRIGNRVLSDYQSALSDHNRRLKRWAEYYRRWRAKVDPPAPGEEDMSNLAVPYIRWNIFTKWAKEMDSLFGDDAEIVAVPVGPSDYRKDTKISRYMTWRVFSSMKLLGPFCEFVCRKLVFGRSIAYSPWKRETFEVPNPARGGKRETVVDYEGPDFTPLWPDDFVVPAEEVRSLHEFSWVIRKFRVTPDQLLQGEQEGRYQGITKNWETIVNAARASIQRDFQGDEIKLEADDAEGISYQRPLSAGEMLRGLEWYGRWRPLKRGPRGGMSPGAAEWDFDKREMRQRDFVVRYLPDLNLVVGIQDLEELYPTKKNRRPFVEASMFKDGTYWSPGMAELLADIEDELRANHNQATDAGQMAINPPMAYRPASGLDPKNIRLGPRLAIPVDDPVKDIRQIEIHADMGIATWKEQACLAYGERLTGMSDMHLGRQSDRPNAPRTGVQTQQLLEEGNVRISLDTKVLREDMSAVLGHFWDLEYMFSPEQVFFRVTEEDADGLFKVANGASTLTAEERDGRYDFRLQFANSVYSKEMKKQQALARYQLDMQNPLVVQNPVALWECTKAAHDALGDKNFEALVPKPPQPDISIDPKVEWTMLLQGEDVHVNPMDNDQLHLIRHHKDLQVAQSDPEGASDPEAFAKLKAHYADHISQLQAKKIQQAVLEQAMQAAQQLAGADPLKMPGGLFGGPPTQPEGNPQAQGPYLYSGHPEVMHEQ